MSTVTVVVTSLHSIHELTRLMLESCGVCWHQPSILAAVFYVYLWLVFLACVGDLRHSILPLT